MFNINMNIRHLILKVLNFHLYAQTKMARNGGSSTTPFVFSEGNYLQPADRYTSQLQSSTWSGVSYCFPKCVPTCSIPFCFWISLLRLPTFIQYNGGTTNCNVRFVKNVARKCQRLGSMWLLLSRGSEDLAKKNRPGQRFFSLRSGKSRCE